MLELVAPTKRRSMSKARAARLFLTSNGICCNCGKQIRQGEGWFIEHVQSLAQGGADDDQNAKPAHTKCKAEKDATDAASKAKRDRIVTAGWEGKRKSRFQSAGFPKAKPQRSATAPLSKRIGHFPENA